MSPAQPLDCVAVETLTRKLMLIVKEHYLLRPTVRSTAQEALNALAITTAYIMLGARECGDEEGARAFFEFALANQLADTVQAMEDVHG